MFTVSDLNADRSRAGEIMILSGKYDMPQGFAADHIERGTSLDAVRGLVFDYAAAIAEAMPSISNATHLHTAENGAAASWARAFARVGVKV